MSSTQVEPVADLTVTHAPAHSDLHVTPFGEPSAAASPHTHAGDEVVALPLLPALASGVPLSVFSFSAVITMLSLANAGIIGSGAMLVPVVAVLGFLGIGIGGLYELRNNDLFGGTFGVAYGVFLLATGITVRFFAPAADADAATVKGFGEALGSWFLLFAVVSVVFTVAAMLVNKTAMLAFGLLAVTLLLLGLANVLGGSAAPDLAKAGGYVGLLDGVAAFWLAAGLLLNTMFGRDLLPLGAPKAA